MFGVQHADRGQWVLIIVLNIYQLSTVYLVLLKVGIINDNINGPQRACIPVGIVTRLTDPCWDVCAVSTWCLGYTV